MSSLWLDVYLQAHRKICAAIRSEVKIYQPSGIHVYTGKEYKFFIKYDDWDFFQAVSSTRLQVKSTVVIPRVTNLILQSSFLIKSQW